MVEQTNRDNHQEWQAKILGQGLDQLGQAMLIVSCRGEVVFKSKAADEILKAGRGVRVENDQLMADMAPDNKRLQEAIQSVIEENSECNALGLYVHNGERTRPVNLTISKMPKAKDERRNGNHALILIKDLNLNQTFWVDRLKDEYKLSPREVQCIELLSEGRDLKDLSAVMEIGIETVRQYMKNIYKKMGVHKQHELVSLALEYRRNR